MPISEALMLDHGRYRAFHGLSPLPAPNEATPLIMSLGGDRERCLTPTAIYLIMKNVFVQAAEALASADPAGADKLRRASTHWLRHTAATHQADAGNDLRFMQKKTATCLSGDDGHLLARRR